MIVLQLIILFGYLVFDIAVARFSLSYSGGQLSAPLLTVLFLIGFLGAFIWMAAGPIVADLFTPPAPVYNTAAGFVHL